MLCVRGYIERECFVRSLLAFNVVLSLQLPLQLYYLVFKVVLLSQFWSRVEVVLISSYYSVVERTTDMGIAQASLCLRVLEKGGGLGGVRLSERTLTC